MSEAFTQTPCMGCTERTPGCHSKCPKTARGEYGYGEWKRDYEERKSKIPSRAFTEAYQKTLIQCHKRRTR